jgi:hypothetical protein
MSIVAQLVSQSREKTLELKEETLPQLVPAFNSKHTKGDTYENEHEHQETG